MSNRESRVFVVVALTAVLTFAFALTEVQSQRVSTRAGAEIFELNFDDGGPPGRAIQIAFTGRAETAFFGLLKGKAENLQRKKPGTILGEWEEQVVANYPENPENPTNPRLFNQVIDTLTTPKGSIFWEGLETLCPAADGVLASTSTEFGTAGTATITGGTGKYYGITGTATLTGRLNVCPVGTPGCAETDDPNLPPGLGVHTNYVWVLHGMLPPRGDGDDDDDDGM